DHDPVFDVGAYGEKAKPTMVAIMGAFTDHMPGFNPQPTPSTPPSFLHKNIWDVAADKSLYTDASHPQGGATPTQDQVWHMLRSLYLGAKQTTLAAFTADPAGGNCYWNDARAHFKPFTFDSVQDVAAESQTLTNSYGQAFCPLRAAQWL